MAGRDRRGAFAQSRERDMHAMRERGAKLLVELCGNSRAVEAPPPWISQTKLLISMCVCGLISAATIVHGDPNS
jgi:hypothetical protein